MNYSGWHNKEGQEVLRQEIKRLKEVKNVPYSTFTDEVVSIHLLSMFVNGRRNLSLPKFLYLLDKFNDYLSN